VFFCHNRTAIQGGKKADSIQKGQVEAVGVWRALAFALSGRNLLRLCCFVLGLGHFLLCLGRFLFRLHRFLLRFGCPRNNRRVITLFVG